ncbi:MAG TPA: PspC domain-containing protein [Candidatus Dormibacteraeota bacterium]|nr:PspC domain-containing protein [Candidatus Dormibacteraeota bacterium]
MTTQDPQTSGAIRRLRRRTSDRVIGGVAGGLGDYLNVDPLLIRIAFVGLMIFGGAGLVLYVIAWLLIPHEGSDQSTVERLIRRIGMRSRNLLLVVVVVLATYFLVWGILPRISDGLYLGIDPALIWALVVLVLGVLVLRREDPPRPAMDASVLAPGVASRVEVSAPPAVAVEKPRSPLGWYVLAAMLCAIGLLAIVQNVGQLDVELGQFFGVALVLLGGGLVVGAWWGHARLLILLGLLLLPLGIVASFVTAPIEGGFGDQTFAPVTRGELREEYRLVGGRMVLDLTQLEAGLDPIQLDASVAVGQLLVLVPPAGSLDVQVTVGGGVVRFLDTYQEGTSLRDHYIRVGRGPTLVLALEAGIGGVVVAPPNTSNSLCPGCEYCPMFASCGYELVPGEN